MRQAAAEIQWNPQTCWMRWLTKPPEWLVHFLISSHTTHLSPTVSLSLSLISLNLSDSDMLTILDGDEVTTRILGQFVGGTSPFKMSSSTPDLTITFHSDPAGLVFGKGEGFIINYMGKDTLANS